MSIEDDVRLLLLHIDRLGIKPTSGVRGWAGHMGATLTDAALQRRTRYRQVVLPRVLDVLRLWPDATTVTAFQRRMDAEDIGAVIRWRRPAKLVVLAQLVTAMADLGIETVDGLRQHLCDPDLRDAAVRRLREIGGVGSKTVDYLGVLVGITDRVAVDTQLRQFAAAAGIGDQSYGHLQRVYVAAAIARGWSPSALDAAIWKYMNERCV